MRTILQSFALNLKLYVNEDLPLQEIGEFLVLIDEWVWIVVLRDQVQTLHKLEKY